MTEVLFSQEDASVNFVTRCPNGGAFESRYVRREDSYFICYLSSHSGCNMACRFCHLTQTGQTMMESATIDDFLAQARLVFEHYKTQPPAERVNFNFMARGEPLSNTTIQMEWKALYDALRALAAEYGVEPKFNISTIYPVEFKWGLAETFAGTDVNFYYSAYSVDKFNFRKKWIPKAWSVRYALEQFRVWQARTGGLLTLHWAFIEGENDSIKDLNEIIYNVRYEELKCKFNLVRYNPYSPAQGKEPSEEKLQELFDYMNRALDHPNSRIVPRVGFDVKASCGMFVEPNRLTDDQNLLSAESVNSLGSTK